MVLERKITFKKSVNDERKIEKLNHFKLKISILQEISF